jgi:hypothetical protein
MITTFNIVFFLTILFTRIYLLIRPTASPTIGELRLHHYMYGILLVFLAIPLENLILGAVGWGLFIDELTYILINGKNHKDNYSRISLLGTFVFAALSIAFSQSILDFIKQLA